MAGGPARRVTPLIVRLPGLDGTGLLLDDAAQALAPDFLLQSAPQAGARDIRDFCRVESASSAGTSPPKHRALP